MLHMCSYLKLCCIDPALGRLDYDSLSDQALMEMLVDNLHPTQKKLTIKTHAIGLRSAAWMLGWMNFS